VEQLIHPAWKTQASFHHRSQWITYRINSRVHVLEIAIAPLASLFISYTAAPSSLCASETSTLSCNLISTTYPSMADLKDATVVKPVNIVADVDISNTRDDALVFLEQHHGESVEAINLRALRKKVDAFVMPFLCIAYTFNFLDKVILNVSIAHHIRHSVDQADHYTVCSDHGHVDCAPSQRQQLLQRFSRFLHCRPYCRLAKRLDLEQSPSK